MRSSRLRLTRTNVFVWRWSFNGTLWQQQFSSATTVFWFKAFVSLEIGCCLRMARVAVQATTLKRSISSSGCSTIFQSLGRTRPRVELQDLPASKWTPCYRDNQIQTNPYANVFTWKNTRTTWGAFTVHREKNPTVFWYPPSSQAFRFNYKCLPGCSHCSSCDWTFLRCSWQSCSMPSVR